MSPRRPFVPVLTVLLWVPMALPTVARAENWPCWRGPRGDGLSSESPLPSAWSPEEGITWKIPVEGRGHSSPIIWEDDLFITSADEKGENRLLFRMDRKTGSIVWRQVVLQTTPESIHPLNSLASSTPATDGKLVYVTFLDRDQTYVAAYDFAGNRVWENRPGPFASKHGFCSSPVIHGDKLIVNGDHDGESYLVLFEKDSGREVWKVPRRFKTRSYSVPRVLEIDGKEQIILTGSFATSGFAFDTGELLWSVEGPSEQMVASILEDGDLLFAMGGFPERHLLAIRKGGTGDITQSHIVWRTHRGVPYVPSALLYDHLLHVVSDEGMYSCYDPPTGKQLQQRRISTHISSSIVGGDGKLYVTADSGETTVLANSSEFKIIDRSSIGEEVYSTPAISQGSIFIRGVQHLFRIDGR